MNAGASRSTHTGPRPSIPDTGPRPLRGFRSEVSKVLTTKTWWLLGLVALGTCAATLWGHLVEAASHIDLARDTSPMPPPPAGVAPATVAQLQQDFTVNHDLNAQVFKAATNIFTAGQFVGFMLVMLLGLLIVTNEFQHQTATATFLTTPRRGEVVAKLAAAATTGVLFWLITQAIDLATGIVFFHRMGTDNNLSNPIIQRAIALNGLGYLMWATLGIGLGALLRNQIAAVATGIATYLIGYAGGLAIFIVVYTYAIHSTSVLTAAVVLPPVASTIMLSPAHLYDHSAPWWAGVLSMTGWTIAAAGIGTLLIQKRNIS
jgi:ABC-2 type transport system permease protein